jgi:hypothetical protein
LRFGIPRIIYRALAGVINPESEGKILEIVRKVKVQGEDRRVNRLRFHQRQGPLEDCNSSLGLLIFERREFT